MTDDLSGTSSRLMLDGLAPGFDYNKAEPSAALVGRTVVLVDDRGTRIIHNFDTRTVRWTYLPGVGDEIPESSGEDPYEAFGVAEGLVYAQFHHVHLPFEAVSLVLDFVSGRALSVINVVREPEPGRTRVRQVFVSSSIEGIETTVLAPALSTALVGRRVLWEYSPEQAYEHVHLSPNRFSWQCLAGPEEGLADTDECTSYELRPGIFVFAWREKVIPCASVTVADHRDIHSLRAHGVLFGLDRSGTEPIHFTFGTVGKLLSNTVYPTEFDPSRQSRSGGRFGSDESDPGRRVFFG
ncbi:MoaF C-terminal domain-containing protein [Pseudonocardia acaciae]|uniref:MoaF C-terminal domain-containing protein n=1 Tax=Pseudonocardia acaciae TaxID=551276 RepID=UPI0009FBE815|nr:MoaF C-terminal domain-containing protein [Pseudonocardia acaciae]